jgi:hypothetical protein
MGRRTFVKRYRLLLATPRTKAETVLVWNPYLEQYRDGRDGEAFEIELVESRPEWFEPMDAPVPFYSAFPDGQLANHIYFGELRHNQACRFCHVVGPILDSEEFQQEVEVVLKRLYEAKIKKLTRD